MIGDQPLKTRKFNKKYVGVWETSSLTKHLLPKAPGQWGFGDGLKMEILKMAGTGS